MKKYNTSLKILFNDPVIFNEGFSRLSNISFVTQKGAKCELDIPEEYRNLLMKYLTGIPNKTNTYGAPTGGLDYTQKRITSDKKNREKQQKKEGGALDAIMKYTSTFFGAYASEILNRENFATLMETFNMFVMDSVPFVYCKALNRVMKMMLPILKIYFEEIEDVEEEPQKSASGLKGHDNVLTATIYYEYGRKVLLPKVFKDAVAYNQKVNNYKIKYFKSAAGKEMIYSMLFFKNFSKEFLLNDKFDADKLKEDIIEFNDMYRLSALKHEKKPLDALSAYESFESAVEFDDSNLLSVSNTIKKEISQSKNNTRSGAIAFKQRLVNEYTFYLTTIIEKIFYDDNFVSNITPVCKNELNQFLNFLKSKSKFS